MTDAAPGDSRRRRFFEHLRQELGELRLNTSPGPPAPNGAMILIGRFG